MRGIHDEGQKWTEIKNSKGKQMREKWKDSSPGGLESWRYGRKVKRLKSCRSGTLGKWTLSSGPSVNFNFGPGLGSACCETNKKNLFTKSTEGEREQCSAQRLEDG